MKNNKNETPPTISQLVPNSGVVGDTIKIIGDNIASVKNKVIVNFGNQNVPIVNFSDNVLTVKAPELTGRVQVSVSNNGFLSNTLNFVYNTEIEDNYLNEDKLKIKKIIEGKEPINWVFTGNSITHGAKHTHGMRSYVEIFAERIRGEMQRFTDYIINTAISGHTTENILNDFDRRIIQFNPKVVILMIGTNDAALDRNISVDQYENNLHQLVQKIREINAVPILLSPNIIIEEKSPERSRLTEYVARMQKIAKSENVIFIDIWKIWKDELQIKYGGEVFKRLLNDPLHPNGFGHQEIAIALFKELSIFDVSAPTCGAPYYEGYH